MSELLEVMWTLPAVGAVLAGLALAVSGFVVGYVGAVVVCQRVIDRQQAPTVTWDQMAAIGNAGQRPPLKYRRAAGPKPLYPKSQEPARP